MELLTIQPPLLRDEGMGGQNKDNLFLAAGESRIDLVESKSCYFLMPLRSCALHVSCMKQVKGI